MPGKRNVKDAGRPADAVERAAWAGFLATHTHLARHLDADLQAGHALSLAAFDVLMQLSVADGRRLRITALADAVHFSAGGVSKLVTRLEREALVCREPDPADGRATLVVLTDAGLRRLRDARTDHFADVRRRFLDRLDADELATLAAIWKRLLTEP